MTPLEKLRYHVTGAAKRGESTPIIGWVTSDAGAAAKLRAADRRYEAARRAAAGLCLQDKIIALREAKARREAVYEAVQGGQKITEL